MEYKEHSKIKREYDKFKEIRREFGLKSFDLINIEQMEKNLKGKKRGMDM